MEMRFARHFLFLACLLLATSGCAFMSDEDRDFYGKGWVNPRELDTPMAHHAVPNPENPDDPAVSNQAEPLDSAGARDEWEDPMARPSHGGD